MIFADRVQCLLANLMNLDHGSHAMDPSHTIHRFTMILLRNVFTAKKKGNEDFEHFFQLSTTKELRRYVHMTFFYLLSSV